MRSVREAPRASLIRSAPARPRTWLSVSPVFSSRSPIAGSSPRRFDRDQVLGVRSPIGMIVGRCGLDYDAPTARQEVLAVFGDPAP